MFLTAVVTAQVCICGLDYSYFCGSVPSLSNSKVCACVHVRVLHSRVNRDTCTCNVLMLSSGSVFLGCVLLHELHRRTAGPMKFDNYDVIHVRPF